MKLVSSVLSIQIPYKPETLLLNYLSDIPKDQQIIVLHMITTARLVFVQQWKQKKTPIQQD